MTARPLLWLAGGLALAGCDLAPDYTPPVVAVPATYTEAGDWQKAEPLDALPRGPWWEAYQDPELDRLEERIDAGNPTLAAEAAIYDQARAFAQEAESGLFPVVGLGGTISENRQSKRRPLRSANQPTYYGANTIDAQAGFEVDLWGRIHDLVQAGKAQAQAGSADLEAVRLSLHAELASDYLTLRGLDEEIALLQSTTDNYRRALGLVQARFQGAIASGVDVSQAETQLSSATAQISDYVSRRALMEHAIATLIGEPAPAFTLARSAAPVTQPDVPAGVPSTLLQRRPDVAAAERQVAASNELVGVAKAAYYPRLSLSLLGGAQDTGFNLVSLPNSIWSVGPSLSLPLFEGGLRDAQLAASQAALVQAVQRYRATVLGAFQDVEDGLAEMHYLGQSLRDQEAAAGSAKRSTDLALTLYRDGAENYLQVVVAQNAELSAEQTALDLRTRRLEASVGLIRALGGGWTTDQLPTEKSL
jgi:NodT family efflux transporter outer membrane factor (OMF) lipoprotein